MAQKVQEFGCYPEIILAERRLNDSMEKYIAEQVVKAMIKKDSTVNDIIHVLGFKKTNHY